jgi:integrase
MATLYRRHGIYYVKFILDGIEIRRSLKTRDEEKAKDEKEALESILSGAASNPTPCSIPADIALPELTERFTEWAERHTRIETQKIRTYALGKWKAFDDDTTIARLTPQRIEEWKTCLLADGLGERSVNICIANMSQIVNRAIRMKWYLGSNPFTEVQRFREKGKIPRWLSKDQIAAVMEVAELHSRNQHLVFGLALFAGLRKKEITFSRGEWFRVDHTANHGATGVVHVQNGNEFQLKDSEARAVPLHATLRDILVRYDALKPGYVIEPDAHARGRYRFDIRKSFRAVLKEAGKRLGETKKTPEKDKLAGWCTVHTLRHSFASRLVQEGVSLYKVASWLGHSDVSTTQIYSHLEPQDDDIAKL